MKKIISTLLVVIVLFNFIFYNGVYATGDEVFEGTESIGEDSISPASQEGLVNEGSTGSGIIVWDILGAIFGTIAGILAAVIDIFPMLIQLTLSIVVSDNVNDREAFTIESTVFNEFGIFNINYFNFERFQFLGTSGTNATFIPGANIKIKESVAQFFILMRLIAIAASLLVLIYVGIRMALSTIASDQAKYKSMLISWVESIAILFLMQYIISIMFGIGNIFENIAYDIKNILNATSFETTINDKIYGNMIGNAGWTYVLYSVVFWVLVFIQLKFFLMYFKRVITVGFLILIAPLVTITYPIDKLGDGKAQAFSVWFNELAMNIFIQPIHAFIYIVFMYTAGEIASKSIFVALIFLLALTKVEKIILYLFNLKNVVSLQPVDDQKKK